MGRLVSDGVSSSADQNILGLGDEGDQSPRERRVRVLTSGFVAFIIDQYTVQLGPALSLQDGEFVTRLSRRHLHAQILGFRSGKMTQSPLG